jgi:hypothetical protein
MMPDADGTLRIRLPYRWQPRNYQLGVWGALERGVKRVCAIWHRRAGKDEFALRWTSCAAHERVGNYWHMLPKASQARKAIWTAVNPHSGVRRIDEAFPLALRATTNEQEMFIRFTNGSTWQVVGSDNFNSLLGSPPIGVVFSEFSLADPQSWSLLRPILVENDGWSLFITTPRGRNHAFKMYDGAKGDPNWFVELLTVKDTGAIPLARIEQERKEMTREMGADEANAVIEQEYFCSFDASFPGAYFGALMTQAIGEGRIMSLPYDPRGGVVTAWDIGFHDSNAIVFGQEVGPWVNFIDYIEHSGKGADFYAKQLRDRPYVYDEHLLPHDVSVHEWGNNGTSRKQALLDLQVRPIRVMPKTSVMDRINAARMMINRARFDAKKCERLVECLQQYHKVWDDSKMMWGDDPEHDWTSHGADAFGTFGQGFRGSQNPRLKPKAPKKEPMARAWAAAGNSWAGL